MKKSIIVSAMFVILVCFVPNAFSADVAKIGVVFMQKVLVESSAGKIIKNQLETRNNEMVKVLTDEKKNLDIMASEIKKMELLPESLDKKKMDEKKKTFESRAKALFQLEKQSRDELKKMEAGLMGKFSKDLNEIVREIGKKEGYLLILERREAGIFYAPDQIDITDSVIKILNQQTAKIK